MSARCPTGKYHIGIRSALAGGGYMTHLDWSARVLGLHLGLGDLQCLAICHGYANGCPCSECLERAERKPMKPAPQPWEAAA